MKATWAAWLVALIVGIGHTSCSRTELETGAPSHPEQDASSTPSCAECDAGGEPRPAPDAHPDVTFFDRFAPPDASMDAGQDSGADATGFECGAMTCSVGEVCVETSGGCIPTGGACVTSADCCSALCCFEPGQVQGVCLAGGAPPDGGCGASDEGGVSTTYVCVPMPAGCDGRISCTCAAQIPLCPFCISACDCAAEVCPECSSSNGNYAVCGGV